MTGWAIFLSSAALCVGIQAWAQEAVELKAKAQSEVHQAGELKSFSTNAQVSGAMLSLKDPLPEVRGRSWDYFLRFSLQKFQPRGSGGNDLIESRFELGEAAPMILPSVAVGFRSALWSNRSLTLHGGLGGRVAYMSEKVSARFATGRVETDAHLNTTLLSADPFLSLTLTRWPSWALNMGGEFGSINYTQSSGNKLAVFSEHGQFVGWNLGPELSLNSYASLMLNYSHHSPVGKAPVGVPEDNVELGTRITW